MYTVFRAPGWHGEPSDPIILETDDEREAAMRAGLNVSLGMPGDCNTHDAYAQDGDGNPVEPIMSFCCDKCGELTEWGESGPTGTMDGRVLECAGAMESHLVTWVCDECAEEMEWPGN